MGFWQSTQAEVKLEPKEDWTILALEKREPSDISYFLDCIEEGRESDMNARAASHLTDILLTAYKSAATGVAEVVCEAV